MHLLIFVFQTIVHKCEANKLFHYYKLSSDEQIVDFVFDKLIIKL